MLIEEITESFVQVFGRNKGTVVRKYRCTSGSRRGRTVANPTTCSAPKNVKASNTMKTTHRKKGPAMSVKSSRTKKSNATSRNVSRQNRSRQTMKVSPKPRKKSKI
jgi:hypothetical protein